MKLPDGVKGDAALSPCGSYRYLLVREWDWSRPAVVWAMLNPSTADATVDDRTLRRVQAYSRVWGRGRCYVVNLFGLRATDPRDLYGTADPVGPGNDDVIDAVLGAAGLWAGGDGPGLVAAWGAWGSRFPERVQAVMNLAARNHLVLHRLGPPLKGGQPRHPCRAPDGLAPEVHW